MKPRPYVTVYKPVAGWKAVVMWWNDEDGGFWEPWQTSPFAFGSEQEAEAWARSWASAEGMEFVPRIKEGLWPEKRRPA